MKLFSSIFLAASTLAGTPVSVTLLWDDPSAVQDSVTNYVVFARWNTNAFAQVLQVPFVGAVSNIAATVIVTNAGTWQWYVQAQNYAGQSPPSQTTTLAIAITPSPVGNVRSFTTSTN